jgi:thioredoxin 1
MSTHTAAAGNAVTPVSPTTLDEILGTSEVPVLVDFWAEWCGPCHTLDPILASIADDVGDRLRIVSVDVDAHPELARRYDAMSVPTLLVIDRGTPVKRLVGARGRNHLLAELADVLPA